MTVYLDLVVILNFLVDLLLLLGTNRLAGFPMALGRCVGAAALGGIYSGACLVRGFRFLGSAVWRMVFLGLICLIAFGFGAGAKKRWGLFVLLSMALGGIAISVGNGQFLSLILCAGGLWLLCRVGFGGRAGGREYVPMTLSYDGKTVQLTALRDTGNTLRDPITGEQVFLICSDAAERLTGLSRNQMLHPLETLASRPIPGLRLIPYRAVGCGAGMLLAMRFEEVRLGREVRPAVVAFAPEGMGSEHQALVGA